MEGLELICFQIISEVGSARSFYIEAIKEAKQGNFEEANNLVSEGDACFVKGHHVHGELIQKEANNEKTEISLLLIHTEDLLISTETFKVLAEEFIDLYRMVIG